MSAQVLPFSPAGWVYVASNPAMPGYCKVGQTTRDPAERVAELDDTGAPLPYRLVVAWPVEHVQDAERAAHDALARFRVRDTREWFRIAPSRAVRRLNPILSTDRCVRLRTRLWRVPLAAANAVAAGIGWTVIIGLILGALT